MSAIFVEGGRADHVQLAAGQHRLEHVAGVHGAFRGAGAHHGVQLVDEEQDPAFGAIHLVEDRFEPLLELAPVLRPGNQRTHVQGEDRLVAQPLGHVAIVDPLREPLDNRRLADTRLTNEHRVVLGLAGQDLDSPTDLGVAADHRFQPSCCRLGDQIATVLAERLVRALRRCGGDSLMAPDLGQCGQEAIAGQALLLQQPSGCR